MANNFETLHVKSAIKDRNKFDLSRTHLTTMDFGQIVPLFVEETVPGDKFSVNANYFSRMAPLAKPTYGKFAFKTMTTFVPYYQVADGIDSWFAGKTSWFGLTPQSRYITEEDLHRWFISSDISSSVSSAVSYDYTYVNSSGSRYFLKMTNKGRYQYKVLCSLGYTLPQGVDFQTGSTWYTTIRTKKLSALPILAFAKAYNDWMSQGQKYDSAPLTQWLTTIKHDNTLTVEGQTYYNGNTHVLSYIGLSFILDKIVLNYENDYFTSAWQTPNRPAGEDSFVGATAAIDVPGFNYTNFDEGASVMNGSNDNLMLSWGTLQSGTNSRIYQRALDWLKAYDDWVRRNNYSGSRAVQQIYSRFGIKTEDYRSNYTHVIDTDVTPVSVGDVTAQASDFVSSANTKNNTLLGDYAGKGIMSNQHGFKYEANDYGMLFVFGWYTVTPMMAYGFDRIVLRNNALDYYNPEFDGLGADAISVGEVFCDSTSTSSGAPLDNAVFGYTERYNAYRFGRDKITGDFRHTNANEMNVWHTGRLLGSVRDAGNLVAQSESVNTLPQTGSEYNRMFSITDSSVDHFYVTAQFNVDAIRPMMNINQVPRLGQGDTVIPRNGNTIN